MMLPDFGANASESSACSLAVTAGITQYNMQWMHTPVSSLSVYAASVKFR
jgi:hypothetical protein